MTQYASVKEAREIVGSLLTVVKMNRYDIGIHGSNLHFERIRDQVVTMFQNAGYLVDVRYNDETGRYVLHCTKGE